MQEQQFIGCRTTPAPACQPPRRRQRSGNRSCQRGRFWIWLVAALIGGCSAPSETPSAGSASITFWTVEREPERLAAQQTLAQQFEAATGHSIHLVTLSEDVLLSRLQTTAATPEFPDVVFIPLEQVAPLAQQQWLDADAATAVIRRLGVDSFAAAPLTLVTVASEGDQSPPLAPHAMTYTAVPGDAWGQLLLYRQDWFEAALMASPASWESLEAAAERLHDPPNRRAILLPTAADDRYTQQVFEYLALSNGCQLVDFQGEINLDTVPCLQTLQLYKQLVSAYNPATEVSWKDARQAFLAGQVAMIFWSPFILDELAGLNAAVPVTVSLDPPLYQRVGITTALFGYSDRPLQWGALNYFALMRTAPPEAQDWVAFILSDTHYLDWLAMAPEGKLPLRDGFLTRWAALEIGVDRKVPIQDLYSDQSIERLIQGVEHLDRWGLKQNRGLCVSAIYETHTVTQILRRYLDNDIPTPQQALTEMTTAVRRLPGCD